MSNTKSPPIDMMYFVCKLLLRTDMKSIKINKIMDKKLLRTQGHVIKEYVSLIKKTCKYQSRQFDNEFMGYTNVSKIYYHIDETNNEMLVMIIQLDPNKEKDQEIITIIKVYS